MNYWEIIADRLHAEGRSYRIAEHLTKRGVLLTMAASCPVHRSPLTLTTWFSGQSKNGRREQKGCRSFGVCGSRRNSLAWFTSRKDRHRSALHFWTGYPDIRQQRSYLKRA